jgi:hypothetical protein
MAFDIESLLQFRPAKFWCEKCFALWKYPTIEMREEEHKDFLTCQVCKVRYVPTDNTTVLGIESYLKEMSPQPLRDVKDLILHATQLGRIAQQFKRKENFYPPVRSLLRAILHAKSFIHFVSYGISPTMIGILKLAAQYVPVRGIISGNVGEQIISEVTDFAYEAPSLSLCFWKHGNVRGMDEPHQKLIVIDGLVAFKGSANLTHMAWRSANNGMDIIEVVSDVEEVIKLHNTFFSPLWAKQSKIEDEIRMDRDDVPF